MRIDADKTISFTVTFNDDGSARATLEYENFIPSSTKVELVDNQGNLIFIGITTVVTLSETGAGYQIDLEDPLSAGAMNDVSFSGMPIEFPADGTKQEIDDWCAVYDLRYYYAKTGHYTQTRDWIIINAFIPDNDIIEHEIRFGVNRGDYFNRLIVTGRAEKDILVTESTVMPSLGYSGVSVTETRSGNRLLSRKIVEGPNVTTENWTWDDNNNVCAMYTKVEEYTGPAGPARTHTVSAVRTVSDISDDISEYKIHQEVKHLADIGIMRLETLDIVREADGSGRKTLHIQEVARNKYTRTVTMTAQVRDDTGTSSWQTITFVQSIFPWDMLLPEFEEITIYNRVNDRPHSFTIKKSPRLVDNFSSAYIEMVPTDFAYGNEDPEQPEMEEAIRTIAAEVKYIEEWDQGIGAYERIEQLPHVDIPENIETDDALYDWLLQRAKTYAKRKRQRSAFKDEITITLAWNYADFNIGDRVDVAGETWEITSIQNTLNDKTAQMTIVGERPSTQTMPKKSQISVGALLVGTMRRLDENQDNIQSAVVVRPISAEKAIVQKSGKTYKISNPNRGPLWAGSRIAVYRHTGQPPREFGG